MRQVVCQTGKQPGFTGMAVVRFWYVYANESVGNAPFLQTSSYTTLALGTMATRPQRSLPEGFIGSAGQDEVVRARACAMVSPGSAKMVLTEFGKGPPVVRPGHAALNRPLRPCTCGLVAERTWQPLHSITSPGRTDNQARCTGLMRRPL